MATPYPQWEYDLLGALGAPASGDNLNALNFWAQSEGDVTNNPLATSGQGAGAANCVAQCESGSPIFEYDNEADGVAQTSKFLRGSFYTKIVSALVNNQGMAAVFEAVNSSPWCSGCQNGSYPNVLAEAIRGGNAVVSSTVGGTGTGGATAGRSGGGGQGGGDGSSNCQPGCWTGTCLQCCVFNAPGLLFGSGPCIVRKGGIKWASGAAAMLVGAGLFTFGVVMIAAYEYQASGAQAAVNKTTRAIGVGTSLLAGQPELAAGIAATGKGKGKRSRRERIKKPVTGAPKRSDEEAAAKEEPAAEKKKDTAAPAPEEEKAAA